MKFIDAGYQWCDVSCKSDAPYCLERKCSTSSEGLPVKFILIALMKLHIVLKNVALKHYIISSQVKFSPLKKWLFIGLSIAEFVRITVLKIHDSWG